MATSLVSRSTSACKPGYSLRWAGQRPRARCFLVGIRGTKGTPPPILTMDGRTTEDTRETSSAPVARMNGLPETTEPGWRAIAAGSPTPTASGMACGSRTSTRTSKHGLVRCGSHWWKAGTHIEGLFSTVLEIYGGAVRPADVPAWHVSVGIPAVDGVDAGCAQTRYPDVEAEDVTSEVRYDTDQRRMHLEAFGATRRQTSQQLIFFPDRAGRVTLSSALPRVGEILRAGCTIPMGPRMPAGSGRGG